MRAEHSGLTTPCCTGCDPAAVAAAAAAAAAAVAAVFIVPFWISSFAGTQALRRVIGLRDRRSLRQPRARHRGQHDGGGAGRPVQRHCLQPRAARRVHSGGQAGSQADGRDAAGARRGAAGGRQKRLCALGHGLRNWSPGCGCRRGGRPRISAAPAERHQLVHAPLLFHRFAWCVSRPLKLPNSTPSHRLQPNSDLSRSSAFKLSHLYPGTVSLSLSGEHACRRHGRTPEGGSDSLRCAPKACSTAPQCTWACGCCACAFKWRLTLASPLCQSTENDEEAPVKERPGYRPLEFLITTGPGELQGLLPRGLGLSGLLPSGLLASGLLASGLLPPGLLQVLWSVMLPRRDLLVQTAAAPRAGACHSAAPAPHAGPVPRLDGLNIVMGRVVEGIDVVRAIAKVRPAAGRPASAAPPRLCGCLRRRRAAWAGRRQAP